MTTIKTLSCLLVAPLLAISSSVAAEGADLGPWL